LISTKGKLLVIILVLTAAFLTHTIALIFLGVLMFFLLIRGIMRVIQTHKVFFIHEMKTKLYDFKIRTLQNKVKTIIMQLLGILCILIIVLTLVFFYQDSLQFALRILGITPTFQNWPRSATVADQSNPSLIIAKIISQFAIYSVSAAFPIFILAIPGIYTVLKRWKQTKELTTIEGIFFCWLFLLTLIGLRLSTNPFIQRIRGELVIPFSFFAIKVLPKIDDNLSDRIRGNHSSEKIFLFAILPFLAILTLHPGITPYVLFEVPRSNFELLAFLKLAVINYMKYLVAFSLLIYIFYKLYSIKISTRLVYKQRSVFIILFILLLVGAPLANNIEFLDPQDVRFKSSDLDAVEWMKTNILPSNSIIYAHALHPTILWLSYYLQDYRITPFASIFDFGDFEQWNERLPYLWTEIASADNISPSTDHILGERSIQLTLHQNELTAISHEILIQSRRTDFYRNDQNNITISFWVKTFSQNNSIPFILLEDAVEGIDESVILFFSSNNSDSQKLLELDENMQLIYTETAVWSHIRFNVSRFWFETYHQPLPARMHVTIGIKNYEIHNYEISDASKVLFDGISFQSGTIEIERPLLSLIKENAKSMSLAQYIFLGSDSALNLPYGYISFVPREQFSESNLFLNVYSKKESNIYLYQH